METIDKEIKYWCGTSWHGDYVISTVEELRTIFGPPDLVGGKTDKVQFEWLLDLEVSNSLGTSAVITIYDWKEYRNYHEESFIRFHIGGLTSNITELAQAEIENVLNLFRND